MKEPEWIEKTLAALRADDLERALRTSPGVGGVIEHGGRRILNFASNDYLDLARHPEVRAAAQQALQEYGAGAGASRLVTGNLPLHEELEAALAQHKRRPTSLLFGSGYLANAGIVTACVGRGDTVFADRLVHASLIDAILLSRATLRRFRHNDAAHLRECLSKHRGGGRLLVVTESVFSMDGDLAPLREIVACAQEKQAMMLIDEAHASGVFGPGGAGRVVEENLQDEIHFCMGTLSKAYGSYGGFVACSPKMRKFLINRARSLIYTTALPPPVVGAVLGALRVLQSDPERGARLLHRAEQFRDRLRGVGLNVLNSASQIIPILVGENRKALDLAERLRRDDIVAVAIRPPTVPAGTARIRFSLTAAHDESDLDRAFEHLVRASRELGLL